MNAEIGKHSLEFLPFESKHFSEFQSWFADPELNKWLGPMEADDPWLAATLQQTNGQTFGVWESSELVAVVGVTHRNDQHDYLVINQIAVKPEHRNQGLGSRVLSELREVYPGQAWKIFVDEKNTRAVDFFARQGWVQGSADSEGMVEFDFRKSKLP
jgi:ribosomal protein S18 acetylase RimI-like enzyme